MSSSKGDLEISRSDLLQDPLSTSYLVLSALPQEEKIIVKCIFKAQLGRNDTGNKLITTRFPASG